jgi:hypothetical protein
MPGLSTRAGGEGINEHNEAKSQIAFPQGKAGQYRGSDLTGYGLNYLSDGEE